MSDGEKGDTGLVERIKALAKLTCIANKPLESRILQCKGILKDASSHRYGFFFELPQFVQIDTSENRATWRPVPLSKYLQTSSTASSKNLPPLGDRIKLARMITESLFILHGVNWVHKK